MKDFLFSPILQRLLDEPDLHLDKIREDSESFANLVEEQARSLLPIVAAIPTLASIAIYVFGSDGKTLAKVCPEGWPHAISPTSLLDQLPSPGEAPTVLLLDIPSGGSLRAVCLENSATLQVNLPLTIRDKMSGNPDARLLLCTNLALTVSALEASARSFDLSRLQQRVVGAVVRSGSGRAAADELGLSYETVREAISLVARRIAVPNLPALVRRVAEAAFGIVPTHFGNAEEMANWLPLTERQCQICELITEGIDRQAVARAMGLSVAVIKKELEQIYPLLEVDSAAGLARVWSEAQALRFFAQATDGPMGFFDSSIEPTRFLPRNSDRQLIAWSDYGPASGKPVLLVHSNWTCRAVPRMMVMRLQAAGWRPIAIDRPGFGMTRPGSLSVSDPFGQAVSDTVAVLDRLKIARAAVITRRAGQFTTVLKRALGERIGPIILTSPSVPTTERGLRRGIVGVIKEAFSRSPQLVGLYFRLITPQLSLKRMEKITREICKGSPPDEKLCEDPQFIIDRFRAIRPFSTGNLDGAVIEELQVSRDLFHLEPLSDPNMIIVHGRHDNHYSVEEVTAYWHEKLPEAGLVTVEDGGQFLTSSHAELLVDLLARAADR